MRQIEVTGNNQKQLEIVYHNKIHEINLALKKMYEQYHNWDTVCRFTTHTLTHQTKS